MDFVFGLPPDAAGNTGVVVFVDRLSKMAHLATVPDIIEGEGTATLFLDRVSLIETPVSRASSGRPSSRCLALAWTCPPRIIRRPTVRRNASTALSRVLRSICAETPKRWSAKLPLVEFALNNAVHTSTGYTPSYVNCLSHHPRVPMTPPRPGSGLSGGEEFAERLADISPLAVRKQVDTFLSTRLSVLRHLRDAMAESQDKLKEHADARGRNNLASYSVGALVLLNSKTLPTHAVSIVFNTKLRPRYIRHFKVVAKKGLADLAEPLADMPAGQSDHDGNPIVPEELGPRPAAGAASQSQRNSDRHADERPGRALGAHSNSERTQSPRLTSPEASAAARRPPPALLDEQGNHHYHVGRILARRRCRGQNQYLVKGGGYPHSENPWEFEWPLRQDCPDVVDAFDQLD
ncbi:unnamed protein product [Phytophthora fragariaefolia]|uniref:Unnamed protein product n=1 Tax=Phytophthora fragariaefolia TaxID=1490495 RepID=A0A9W7D525_9STRA|nr:unnamed protein product [Phytophthora fragariaefolia]